MAVNEVPHIFFLMRWSFRLDSMLDTACSSIPERLHEVQLMHITHYTEPEGKANFVKILVLILSTVTQYGPRRAHSVTD